MVPQFRRMTRFCLLLNPSDDHAGTAPTPFLDGGYARISPVATCYFRLEAAQGHVGLELLPRRVGFEQFAGLAGGHIGITDPRPSRRHQVQQRLALAEADTAGTGHDGVELEFLDRLNRRGLDLARPGRDAAGWPIRSGF